jgi:uncharacterized protein YndB with AHSA1/START domain
MATTETLKFERTINAPASEVFTAFTNATALRGWFCDAAEIEPHTGGRVYFAWHQGYRAAGEVKKVVADKKLAFSWAGQGEPVTTQVGISLVVKKNGCRVKVTHAGVRVGKKWAATAAAISMGWERGLENLQSVLETGRDQRFTTLSAQPVAEVPATAPELADAVRKIYASTDDELGSVLQSIRDDEAARSPAPGEWSISEVLAHLVLGERDGHAWLEQWVAGDEHAYSLADGNSAIRLQATARAFGSLAALFEELKRNEAETLAMLGALPDDFVARKRSYWHVANVFLQNADHTRDHLRQMEGALAAARQPR